MKIKTKLILILLTFIILIIGIIGINYSTYQSLDADANFVNSSGRLRASSYRMAQISANLVITPIGNGELKLELSESIELFDNLLPSLISGNSDIGLNKLENESIKSQILNIEREWKELFKPSYKNILEYAKESDLEIINQNVGSYVEKIDKMVSDYAEYSQSKVANAKFQSILILILSLVVGAISAVTIRKGIINPINKISIEMNEISTGRVI